MCVCVCTVTYYNFVFGKKKSCLLFRNILYIKESWRLFFLLGECAANTKKRLLVLALCFFFVNHCKPFRFLPIKAIFPYTHTRACPLWGTTHVFQQYLRFIILLYRTYKHIYIYICTLLIPIWGLIWTLSIY